jgi:hypothetical protein
MNEICNTPAALYRAATLRERVCGLMIQNVKSVAIRLLTCAALYLSAAGASILFMNNSG